MIIPMAIKVDATTISTIIKGINKKDPDHKRHRQLVQDKGRDQDMGRNIPERSPAWAGR
jgi:hypothetical protein